MACSRECSGLPGVTSIRGYVQDFFRDKDVCADLKELLVNGSVKICGNKNTLGKDVLDALEKIADVKQRIQCELWHE